MALIEEAARSCDRVTVVVAANSEESLPLASRVDWLAWASGGFPTVTVVGTVDDHPIEYEDPAIWDAHEAVFRAAVDEVAATVAVDAVFTGEGYGDELARRFAATHLRLPRPQDGPSGTKLRANLFGLWTQLIPPARATLARRIVVLGAESTGTTTLAHDLAEALGAAFVPEYGRAYSAAKLAEARERAHPAGESNPWMDRLHWTSGEFTLIAAQQTSAIEAAAISNPIIVADTDALATSLWHERYVGGPHQAALSLSRIRPPDLYILTTPDGVPFDQDGLRDGEAIRKAMHSSFVRQLQAAGSPWMTVTGSRAERLQDAVVACKPLLESPTFSGSQ